jgi:hypothetical protein
VEALPVVAGELGAGWILAVFVRSSNIAQKTKADMRMAANAAIPHKPRKPFLRSARSLLRMALRSSRIVIGDLLVEEAIPNRNDCSNKEE